MKIISVVLLLFLPILAKAQTNAAATATARTNIIAPPQSATTTNKVDPNLLARRAGFIKEYRPLRVIDGKLYDFSPFFIERASGDPAWAERLYSDWLVKGKVIQVTKDGLLVDNESTDLAVFIKNYPRQNSKFDGAAFQSLVVLSGRYQYVNTLGAIKTVVAYDCGHYFNPSNETFTVKHYIKPNGTTEEKPVTEWDLQ